MKKLLLAVAVMTLSVALTNGPAYAVANSHISALNMLPDGGAYCVFAGKFGGEITRQEIAGQRELSVEGCAKGSRIFQFTLVVTKNGKTSTYSAKSSSLTDEMTTQLKSLSAGDSFEFKEVKAYWGKSSDDEVNVRAQKFTVVS